MNTSSGILCSHIACKVTTQPSSLNVFATCLHMNIAQLSFHFQFCRQMRINLHSPKSLIMSRTVLNTQHQQLSEKFKISPLALSCLACGACVALGCLNGFNFYHPIVRSLILCDWGRAAQCCMSQVSNLKAIPFSFVSFYYKFIVNIFLHQTYLLSVAGNK